MKRSSLISAALVAITMLLSGCATPKQMIPVNVERISRPELNKESRAELGETMVSKGVMQTSDGIELKNRLVWGDGVILKRFTLEPGKLVARERDDHWTYYFSDDFKVYDALLGESRMVGGLKLPRAGTEKPKLFQSGIPRGFEPKTVPIYEPVKIMATKENSFKQELIYNGRVADSLKFLYRELSNDFLRPAFSQEIQYDLRESRTIGFKGARVEVLDATNQAIRYQVLSNFQD